MISEKTHRELRAAHAALLYLRLEAFQGRSSREIARVLDDLEYLIALILEERTENYRQVLCDMEAKFPFVCGIVARFDEERAKMPAAA